MRELVILKLLEVLAEQGYVGVPDFLTFPAPTTEAEFVPVLTNSLLSFCTLQACLRGKPFCI